MTIDGHRHAMETQHIEPVHDRRPPYRMEIVWSDEDDAYVVTVPDLPGRMTHGATYEEAARNGAATIALWLAGARHWGTPIPLPSVVGRE